jgi:hypothetical protein
MSKPLASVVSDPAAQALHDWQELHDGGWLLKAAQVAEFTARGFLSFDAIVPADLNRDALAAFEAGAVRGGGYDGVPLEGAYPTSHPIARLLALPQVRGIITSLVGPQPLRDHDAVHTVAAGHRAAQGWHADATIDPRADAFDIQLMYFPHDLPAEMGGTMLLPGSHLRQVHELQVARYHHIVGQIATICPAGTIHVLHHGIWHRGRGNITDRKRYMYKLRLNPTWKQERLFDLDGYRSPEVARILTRPEPWFGVEARLEYLNRLRLWRHLSGDATYDADHWLGRLEARPQRRLEA